VQSSVSPQAVAGSYFNALGAEVLRIVARGNGVAIDFGGTLYPLQPAGGSSFKLGTTLLQFDIPKGSASATALHIKSSDGSSDVATRFAPVAPTAADLQGAAGAYYSPELDVTWRLRVRDHTVALEPARNVPEDAAGKLQPQMRDTFSDAHGFLIRFDRDAAGRIAGFTLSAGRGLRALRFTRS
jgi:hypothetical protein